MTSKAKTLSCEIIEEALEIMRRFPADAHTLRSQKRIIDRELTLWIRAAQEVSHE